MGEGRPDRLRALILSDDPLLSELLTELLRQEHLDVTEVDDLVSLEAAAHASSANVLVVDAIADARLAAALLDDPWTVLGETQPPIVLLAGSATPPEVRDHGFVDRVLTVPLTGELLTGTICRHASGRARRMMRSGVQMRSAVDATFRSKRTPAGGLPRAR